jgi:hypothetical protein
MFILCITGAFLNVGFHLLTTGENLLPLYNDTVFTITVTLFGGPVWGSITGALTNIIGHTNNFWGWEGYIFALCNVAVALITWLFMRLFPKELNLSLSVADQSKQEAIKFLTPTKSRQLDRIMNRIFVLTFLSFALCLVISILGGTISFFIGIIRTSSEAGLSDNPASIPIMVHHNIPLLLKEILSRIPINIIDRLIAAFGGYGIAFVIAFLFRKSFQK